jgi:hypothetical protein
MLKLMILAVCAFFAQAGAMESETSLVYAASAPKRIFMFTKPSPNSFFAEGFEQYNMDPPQHKHKTAYAIKEHLFQKGWLDIPLDLWFGGSSVSVTNLLLRKKEENENYFIFLSVKREEEAKKETKLLNIEVNSVLFSKTSWDYPQKAVVKKQKDSFSEMSWRYIAAHLLSVHIPNFQLEYLPFDQNKEVLFSEVRKNKLENTVTRFVIYLHENKTYTLFSLNDPNTTVQKKCCCAFVQSFETLN